MIKAVQQNIEHKSLNVFSRNFPKKEPTGEELKKLRNKSVEEIKGLVGIISPYKSQVRAIKDKVFKFLRHQCDIQYPQDYIEINTVDAF